VPSLIEKCRNDVILREDESDIAFQAASLEVPRDTTMKWLECNSKQSRSKALPSGEVRGWAAAFYP
jgi:hypothetical protein